MRFKTVQEAFNFYRHFSVEDIEKRAAAIIDEVNSNPEANIEALNIELEALEQVKQNWEDKTAEKRSQFNPITGMNFDQPRFTNDNVFASAEYRSAFFKTLLGQKLMDQEQLAWNRAMELAEKRANLFNVVSDSAAVIPTQTLNEIVSKARDMGGIIAEARQFNVPASLKVPIATPIGRASRHQEGQPVETQKVGLASVTFAPLELIKVLSMSAAVRHTAIDAFEKYLVEELATCVLEQIAYELVNGQGSDEGEGLGVLEGVTWTANTNLVEYTTAPDYTDFAKMMGLLKRGYGRNAKWAMNNSTLYNTVYSLTDQNDRPIFVPDPRNDEVGRILGREVIVDDYLEDGVVLLGDWKYMGWNLANGIMIEVSRESSFKSGLIDFRALAIADTQPLVAEAFVKMDAASQ
jgi:HK97 family phage major capsid protein